MAFPEFVLFCSEDILILKTSMKTIKEQLKSQIYNFEFSSILSFLENFCVKIRVRTD